MGAILDLRVAVVIDISLSSTTVGDPPNANSFVGTVGVTTSTGAPFTGALSIGGADASLFVLSNGGFLPCNLMVGSVDIPDGTYNVTLTAV
jgi:hypothetical protein